MKVIVIVLLSIAGAFFAFFNALSNYAAKSNPALAIEIPITNGFAFARMSDLILQNAVTSKQKIPSPALQNQIWKNASASFEREPFAVNAIRNMGLVAEFKGDEKGARQIMNVASNLTSRDVPTDLWLVQDNGKLGNVEQMLVHYDRPLRHSGLARNALLPSLRDGLKNREMLDPLAALLEKKPPWAIGFWADMASHQESLENAAALRIKLLDAKISYPVATDQYLINAVMGASKLRAAEELYNKLVSRNGNGSIVRNSNFEFESKFFPFEWQLFDNDKFDVEIVGRGKRLSIFGYGNEGGMVARQLVRLPSGRYQLNVDLRILNESKEIPLEIELRCATGHTASTSAMKFVIEKLKTSATIEYSADNCKYTWLELHLIAQPINQDFDVELSSLSITRI